MRSVVAGLALVVALVLAVPAAAFAAGSISGTVTAASGGAAIANIEVCAEGIGASEGFGCDVTAADGTYSVAGLPSGSYKVEFWPPEDANLVPQHYNGKPTWSQATPVVVNDGADMPNIDAALAEGGRIAGHVTDSASNIGIQGILACASLVNEEIGRCAETAGGGGYTIAGLPNGSYEVFFFAEEGEYLSQIFRGNQKELVSVTVGSTTSNVDAALEKPGQISGTVTDALSGAGIGASIVCARQAVTGEIYECASTNGGGQYAIQGLPSGSYKVWFSPDVPEVVDDYFQQYFSGAATFALATPVTVVAPAVTTGINARLISRKAPPVVPPPPAATPISKPPKKHCRKGLKRIKVKGKERCVRIHRQRHHGRGGKRQRLYGAAGAVQFSFDGG
jgi:hypothetical protein